MALVLGKAVIARPRSGEGYTFELPSGVLPEGKQSYLSVNPMGYAEWSRMSEREGFPSLRVGQETRDAVMPSFSRPSRAFTAYNGTGLRPSTDAGRMDALYYRVGERVALSGDGRVAVVSVPETGHHLFLRSDETTAWAWSELLSPADTVPGTAVAVSHTGSVVATLGQSATTATDVVCTIYGDARTPLHTETLAGAAQQVVAPAVAATAATWGAYEAAASSSTATAWQAFASSGDGWVSGAGIYDTTTGLPLPAGGAATLVADPAYVGEYLKLSSTDAATALRGETLVLVRGASVVGAPAAFRVYGSNDDATWELLGDFSGVTWAAEETEKAFPLTDLVKVAERGYKHIAIAVGEVTTDAESSGDGSVAIGAGTRLEATRVQAQVTVSGDGSTVYASYRDAATGDLHVRVVRTGVLDASAPAVAATLQTGLPWGDLQTGKSVATDFFGRTVAVRSASAVEARRLTSAWTDATLVWATLAASAPDVDHTLLGATGLALSASGQEIFVPVRNLVSGRVLVGTARVPYGTWPASATLVVSSEAVTTGPVAVPDAWTAGVRLCAQSPDGTWLSFLLPDGSGYLSCTESSGSSAAVAGGAVHAITERGSMAVFDDVSKTVLSDGTVTATDGVVRVIAGEYAWGSVQDGLVVSYGTWSGTVLANWGMAYYDIAVSGGVVETHEKVTGWEVLRRPPVVLSAPLYSERVTDVSLTFVATKEGSASPPFVVPASTAISVTLNGRFLGRYVNDTAGTVTTYLTKLTAPNTNTAADASSISDTLMTTDVNAASVQTLSLEKDARYTLSVYYYNKGTQTSVSLAGTGTALEIGVGAVFLREPTYVLDLLQSVTFAAGYDPNPSAGQLTPWSLSTTSALDAFTAGRPAKVFNNGLYLIAVADFDLDTEEVFHSNYVEFDEVPAETTPAYYSFRLVNYQTRDVIAYVAIASETNGGVTRAVWGELSSAMMDSVLYYKDPEAPEVITSSSPVTGGGGGSGTTSVITMDGGRADLLSTRSLTGDVLPVVQIYPDGTTSETSAYLDTTGVFQLQGVTLASGTLADPALQFAAAAGTGLFLDGSAVGVSVGGQLAARFVAGAVEIAATALRPTVTGTTSLGSAGLRFNSLYLSGDLNALGDVVVAGAVSATGSAAKIEFPTAGAEADAIRVTGHVLPAAGSTYDLGTPDLRFRSIYVDANTIYLGDVALGVDADGDFRVQKTTTDPELAPAPAAIKMEMLRVSDTVTGNIGSLIHSVDGQTYFEVSHNGTDFSEVLRLGETVSEFTGNVRASGDILALSDARLKTEVQPIRGALDRLAEVQGVTYRFLRNPEDGKRNIGLLAQEVQRVFPEAVTEGSDGMLAVNYGGLVGALVAALNEAREEIRALAGRVAALEAGA